MRCIVACSRVSSCARRAAILTSLAALSACQPVPVTDGLGSDPSSGPGSSAASGAPGSFDSTFGSNGVARVRFGSDDAGGFSALELRADGILAAGTGYGGLGGSGFVAARLTDAGQMDPAFANGALVKTLFVGSTGSYARVSAVGSQGAFGTVLMGWHEHGSVPGNIALERLDASGAADGSFGDGGKLQLDLGGAERIHDGLILPDETILVVGEREDALLVARVTPSGAIDTAFAAPQGFVTVAFQEPASARAVSIDNAGRIVVVGNVGNEGERDLVALRFLPGGTPDPSFGAGGRVVLESPGSDESAAAVVVLASDHIVLAGDSNAGESRDFYLARFNDDGSLDEGFGTRGSALLPVTNGADSAEDLALLPNGQLLMVGNAADGAHPGPVVARYTASGTLDTSFGASGVSSLDLGDDASLHAVQPYPGGRALIAGGDEGGTPGPGTFGVVARLWM